MAAGVHELASCRLKLTSPWHDKQSSDCLLLVCCAGVQVMRVTGGRVLEEIVADIYLMGAKPVGEYEADRVEACIKDLQLDRCADSYSSTLRCTYVFCCMARLVLLLTAIFLLILDSAETNILQG